ncbi:MAG: hypothetical protein NTW06_05005, partial [Candidatus Falkowbacteria bacterium]|nr:hypothetical protein [Candidatus Falkowbacteria bacterium]
VFSVAKEIKKAGETFEQAKVRASKMMKQEKEEANKIVKTEMQKLQEYIKEHKELQGISGTDLGRDATRVAKVGGRRISKNGNIYYENRENRKDRLAPNYPKNAPLLENGGLVRTFDDVLGETKIFKEEKVGKFTIGISSGFRDNRHVYIYEGGLGEYNGKSLPKNFRQSPQLSISEANDYYSHLKKKNEKMELGGAFAPNVSDGTQFMSGVYANGGLIVNNNEDLEEVAKYMTNAVKKYRYDLKDLIYYFEKENNFDYKFRVKIWDEMNGYEMRKTYENILEMLRRIVEANGKKFVNGGAFAPNVSDGTQFMSGVYANGGGVEIEIKGKKHNLSMKNSITKGDKVVLRYPIDNGKRSDNPLDGEVGTIIQVNKDGSYNLYEDYQKHVVKLDNGETVEVLGKYMSVLMPEYANGGEFMTDPTFGNFQNQVYAKGGDLKGFSDNQLMIMNQNVQIEHHHEELEDVLENKTEVPAWVVAKMATATQSISDITHYLDGEKELLEEEEEELMEQEDEEEVIVNNIPLPSAKKTELTKKFTEDALVNLKGFLKGKEGVELEDDYTFTYKGEKFEIEPIIDSDDDGVLNALFTVYNKDEEEVGEITYMRGSGKQKFNAKSNFFKWNNTKFANGGYFDGAIPKVSTYMSNYAKGGTIKGYVEITNPQTELFDKGY